MHRLQGTASYQIKGGFRSLSLDGRTGYAEIPFVDFRKSSFSIAIRFNVQDIHRQGHLISDWSSPFQFRVFVMDRLVHVILRRSGELQYLLRMNSNRLVADPMTSHSLYALIYDSNSLNICDITVCSESVKSMKMKVGRLVLKTYTIIQILVIWITDAAIGSRQQNRVSLFNPLRYTISYFLLQNGWSFNWPAQVSDWSIARRTTSWIKNKKKTKKKCKLKNRNQINLFKLDGARSACPISLAREKRCKVLCKRNKKKIVEKFYFLQKFRSSIV